MSVLEEVVEPLSAENCSLENYLALPDHSMDARIAEAVLAKAGIDNSAQRHILVNVLKRAVHEATA